MYRYDAHDQRLVDERVAQFADQTRRFLAGELTAEQFRPLRLQNGLYIQRHAPMLRIAVPYGLLSSAQLRALAGVARDYDKGYCHFTTRHNVQFNWPELEKVPEILARLAQVQLHAIQTSGNCIRNVTSDAFAGVAADEIVDPRPWCELLRQWSTFHPEFAWLPRKFKIAVSGTADDRAAIRVHDIGLQIVKNDAGQIGFQVFVGGGLGRTPIIGDEITPFLPWQHLLSYCDAILRVYNRYGRRDNPYKARIKILVKALGIEEFRRQVDEEWAHGQNGPLTLTADEVHRVANHFNDPAYAELPDGRAALAVQAAAEKPFARWLERNTLAHRKSGYMAVTLSLKPQGVAPGDLTDRQLDAVADLADRYSFGEIRVTHEQNLVLADVRQDQLHALWQELKAIGLATPNIGLVTDIICCPGGDFCDLANAKSIPVAAAIQEAFEDIDYLFDLGEIELNISGCMNSCGHHHIGHIGILGVDKNNEEWYQITLGGSQGNDTRIGKVIGPSFARDRVAGVVRQILELYVEQREAGERFIDTFRRIGADPFKARVYADSPIAKKPVAKEEHHG